MTQKSGNGGASVPRRKRAKVVRGAYDFKMSHGEFLARLKKAGSNTALAKELGVSEGLIRKHRKRIEAEHVLDAKAGGHVAVAIQAELVNAQPPSSEFTQGLREGYRRIGEMERVDILLTKIDASLHQIESKIKENPKRLQPFLVELMAKMVREARGLIETRSKLRREMFTERGTAAFMEAVTRLLAKKGPELQHELFVELSQLGLGESAGELAAPPHPGPE